MLYFHRRAWQIICIRRPRKKKLNNLELNMEPFGEMGGRYLFSAVPITNAADNHLQLDGVFTAKETVWKIYLYRAVDLLQ